MRDAMWAAESDRRRRGPWRGLLSCVLVCGALFAAAPAGAARPPWRGLPLADALERLRARGLAIVYTSELVRPPMVVSGEPAGRDPRRILDQLLAPHWLRAEEQDGILVVVEALRSGTGVSRIAGTTRSRRGAEPLPGATVWLPELGLAATSDEAGRFVLELPRSGTYTLEARLPGFVANRVEGVAATGEGVEITFELSPEPFLEEEIDVRSSLLSLLDEEPVAPLALDRYRIEALPQLGGDVFRALPLLPGVTANDLTAQIHVRGGRRDEVLILLDGQELYQAHHLEDFDGARSMVAAHSLESLTLTSGNFPSSHGDRMGAVLDMTTRAANERHLRLGLSLLDAQVAGGGNLRGGRGGWFASGRAGTIDLASRIFGSEDPSYGDLFAKAETELGAGQRLRGHALLAGDRLTFREVFDEESKSLDTEYGSSYLWATHDAVLGARTLVESRASWSRIERDRRGVEDEEEGSFLVRDLRDYEVFGAEQTWSLQASARGVVEAGFGARVYQSGYDYTNRADRELVFSTDDESGGVVPPADAIPRFMERFRGEHLGLFGAYRATPVDPLSLELGLRYDRHSLTGDTLWSPRASFAWRLGEASVLRGSWGRYTQSQRPYELEIQDGEDSFAPAERSRQWVVGWERIFGRSDRAPLRALRLEGYRRDIARPRARCENLLEPINVFAEVEPDRFCIHPEASDSAGVELVLRGAAGRRAAWWLSYSYADVRDRVGGKDVPRAIDQPHTLNLQLARRFGKAWELSAAWRYHTGWPTTPARFVPTGDVGDGGEGEVDGEDEGVAVLGPLWSERLPVYHRLDVRLSRSWRVGSGELTFFLDVQNVYDRGNVGGFDVAFDDEEGEPLRLETESWPGFFPSLGVSWEL